MRVIFEEVDSEYFFELILNPTDFERIEMLGGIIGTFVWDGDGIRDVNVYIRKEKEKELCHSLKEKEPVPLKDSPKISRERCTKASRRSKLSRSLIAKRVGGKRRLPKLKRNKE